MSKLSDALLNHQITVHCSGCNVKNSVTLRQIKNETTVRCQGCGRQIKLKVEGTGLNSVTRGLDNFERSLQKLKNIKL